MIRPLLVGESEVCQQETFFVCAPVVFDTIKGFKGFKGIVTGDYDDLPESAFYMVGTIEEAVAKAQKMAAEAA